MSGERHALVAFEAPHRLLDCLADALAELGDRPCAVARELTKIHEEVFRGTLAQAAGRFAQTPPRGEITLVIGGAPGAAEARCDEARVRVELERLLESGLDRKTAARSVAKESGWSRREVYGLE